MSERQNDDDGGRDVRASTSDDPGRGIEAADEGTDPTDSRDVRASTSSDAGRQAPPADDGDDDDDAPATPNH